jgi:hypothetical protein
MKKTTTTTRLSEISINQPIIAVLEIEQLLNKRRLTIKSTEGMNKVSALLSAQFNTLKGLFSTKESAVFDTTRESLCTFTFNISNGATSVDIKGNITSNKANEIILELNRYCANTLLNSAPIDYLELEIAKLDDRNEKRQAKIDGRQAQLIAPKLEREMKYKRVELANIFVS